MIHALHLTWIIPLSFTLGIFVAALFSANHYNDDDGIEETDDSDEDDSIGETDEGKDGEDNDDDGGGVWGDRICGFLVGVLVGMAGMGVAIYFITNDFATLFT